MSYYNYILKSIKIEPNNLKDYNEGDENRYSIFHEGCKDFENLKEAVGISCVSENKEVIILQEVSEGYTMIRPRDIKFPEGTFHGQAGCFILLKDLRKNMTKDLTKKLLRKLLKDKEMMNTLALYEELISSKENLIIMGF